MADVSYWERRFVEEYIASAKQDRYLFFLKGRKHRAKLLERMNHTLDFDRSKAAEIATSDRNRECLLRLLSHNHVHATCYFMADGNESDGRELRIERAVDEMLANHWGAVLICPPKPIALYKEEDVG